MTEFSELMAKFEGLNSTVRSFMADTKEGRKKHEEEHNSIKELLDRHNNSIYGTDERMGILEQVRRNTAFRKMLVKIVWITLTALLIGGGILGYNLKLEPNSKGAHEQQK